nr:MAG TPA: hypothetical protein [Caudoviricetes sp.]
MKAVISNKLLENIIDAYNRENKTNISVSDVETLDLAVPNIYLNGKEVSWMSVRLE